MGRVNRVAISGVVLLTASLASRPGFAQISLAGEWSPDAYHDDYVPALMKVIKAKAAGRKMPAVSGKPTPPTKVVDLMARLKESLAAARASTSAASQRRKPRGRRPAA